MNRDELLKLIDQAACEGWTWLDLRYKELTEFPLGIEQLTSLTDLDLGWNQLTELPPEIAQLTALTSLNLTGNKLTALPPEIGRLTSLTHLDLGFNQLTTLPPELGELAVLRILNLNENYLTKVPSELWKLTALTNLALDHNGLTELPLEINQLYNLVVLDLGGFRRTDPVYLNPLERHYSRNVLTVLPSSIGQLTHLTDLDLSGNNLISLPRTIENLKNLQRLELYHNPIPLPGEIIRRSWEPDTIIRAWLDYLDNKSRPLNEIKLVLVGEGSVGKTSLVNRLLDGTFTPNSEKTEGITIRQWTISSEQPVECDRTGGTTFENRESKIQVNIWDFGGQEIMHATHQFFLTKRTLYVLALDNRLSEAENRVDYWLTLIRSFGGDSPVLVVGNKTDQHTLDLDRRGLLAKYPTAQAVLETSCATGVGIPELRSAIADQIAAMPHVHDPIITTWFEVKAALETLDADYIPYSDYLRLCQEKDVGNPDSQRVLLGFLHDLGVVLHFPDPRLETTNILNPEWVTHGVYRILNTRLSFAEQGVLTWDMLARILADEPYQAKRLFIVDMMQKFELCYEIPDRPHTYLIPDLLSKEMRDTGAWDNALCFEVHYSVLPGSILTRLIVRMHRRIKEQTVWRTGVLLACDDNEALVTADLAANRIAIAVRGPGTGRRELLTRIREHLEGIHASLAGLQAAEKVPVPSHPQIPPVDYKWLRELERKGVPEFYPPGLTDPISVRQLLDGVEPPSARREREGRGGDTYYISNSQIGVAGREASVSDGIHFENEE